MASQEVHQEYASQVHQLEARAAQMMEAEQQEASAHFMRSTSRRYGG